MKTYVFRTCSGEEIEIREFEGHRYACPVCGSLGPGPPWDPGWDRQEDGNLEPDPTNCAAGSFDICPSCKTQFGLDDYVESDEPDALKRRWAELREAWLREVGRTPEVVRQLRNLDIEIAPDSPA